MVNLKSKKINRIVLDETIFRYALEQDETYGALAVNLLEQIEKDEIEQAYISAISYAKLVGYYENEEVARKVQVLLSHFPNLSIMAFDSKAAEQTASIQRKYGLAVDQAVLVATALVTKSQLLVSEIRSMPIDGPIVWWNFEDLKSIHEVN